MGEVTVGLSPPPPPNFFQITAKFQISSLPSLESDVVYLMVTPPAVLIRLDTVEHCTLSVQRNSIYVVLIIINNMHYSICTEYGMSQPRYRLQNHIRSTCMSQVQILQKLLVRIEHYTRVGNTKHEYIDTNTISPGQNTKQTGKKFETRNKHEIFTIRV